MPLRVKGFVWLQDIVEKLWQKHHVEVDEVEQVLTGTSRFRMVEKGNTPGEDVYAGLGRTYSGRYLIVFFVHKKDGRALIVSARSMTEAERKLYGRK